MIKADEIIGLSSQLVYKPLLKLETLIVLMVLIFHYTKSKRSLAYIMNFTQNRQTTALKQHPACCTKLKCDIFHHQFNY